MDASSTDYDFVLVGGGLQNGLLALSLLAEPSRASICLIERNQRLGGNHTWCFHSDDLDQTVATLVEPMVVARWPGYRVSFPRHERELDTPYAMVSSDRFHAHVHRTVTGTSNSDVLLDTEVAAVSGTEVRLRDGRLLRARFVVDARGPERTSIDPERTGYQKFVGLEVETAGPHGVQRPVLMDACVPQSDGYRFLYVLPLASDRLLVEDTRFSDSPDLDRERLQRDIGAYMQERSYSAKRVLRIESGVLPLPWHGDVSVPEPGHPLIAGFQGGWYHPVSGYSFPIAARLARCIAATPIDELWGDDLHLLAGQQRRQLAFAHRLNKMFFRWFAPENRYNVLERFYTLPEPVIRRFYALCMTDLDRARMLMGRPPRGMSYKAALLGRSVL
jgi:lycopene beta-cyclase